MILAVREAGRIIATGAAPSGLGGPMSGAAFAGQNTSALKEVAEKIWLVSFMHYDPGFFDHETGRVECAPNPFGAKLLPMSPEENGDHVLEIGPFSGMCRLRDSNPRPTVYKTVALPLC
jgi:hypothetical protein